MSSRLAVGMRAARRKVWRPEHERSTSIMLNPLLELSRLEVIRFKEALFDAVAVGKSGLGIESRKALLQEEVNCNVVSVADDELELAPQHFTFEFIQDLSAEALNQSVIG